MRRFQNYMAVVLFYAFVATLAAQSETQLTAEMMLDVRYATSAQISPDGSHVAYTLSIPRSASEKPGGRYSELWVVPTSVGEARQFTRKPVSVFSPQWSPDGQRIAFLSRRKDHDSKTQVYAIRLNGGEAQKLTDSPTGVSQFKWMPDGQGIAYTARDPESKEQRADKEAGRDWNIVDTPDKYTRLHVHDLRTNETHTVTLDELRVWEFEPSPDGERFVIRASEGTDVDANYMFSDLFLVPASGGKADLLCERDGKLREPTWSPDGEWIAYRGAVSLNDPTDGSVFVVAAQSGATPKNLTEAFDGTASGLAWLNSRTLMMTSIHGTGIRLSSLDASSGKMKTLIQTGPIFRDVDIDGSGKWFTCLASTPEHPNEIFLGEVGGHRIGRLTKSNPELESVSFAKLETITYAAQDGLEIYGLVAKPLNFDASQKYPLIVQVHGGPESAYLTQWNNRYSVWPQLAAQKGYVYFMPNYRGSTGRGVDYAKADHNDPMGKEFDDILAGIDYLAEQGFIDESRVGIHGGSYGGYATAWAATKHSQRFAAAVMFAGISNQISKLGSNDIPNESAIVHLNFWPYDNFELAWDRSPLKYIENAKTPILIAHGERDRRVPPQQSSELYRALKHVGVQAQLVFYPREPHGLRERPHQLDFLTRSLEWFDRYLQHKGTN